jgi:hypothetical protein
MLVCLPALTEGHELDGKTETQVPKAMIGASSCHVWYEKTLRHLLLKMLYYRSLAYWY